MQTVLKTERLCLWCGGHLMFKKRGTRGDFCNPSHARLKRKRDEARRKMKCTGG